jgi:2-polyprenyl-6-methoxyphenol hydroxylase-like FAD-dependent oxidoreductase
VRIAVVGGGPAALWFARTLKRAEPKHQIAIYEQNTAGATYGFGVVFSRRAIEMLRDADPDALAAIVPAMEMWDGQTMVHRDETVLIDGGGYAGIERITLLTLLREQCARAGVELSYERRITNMEELASSDLVVAADGANSIVRQTFAREFGTVQHSLSNWFAWFGVDVPYATHTLTFRSSATGRFVAHHYRFRPDRGTFLVECDARTWTGLGLDRLTDEHRKRVVEDVFAPELRGQPLIENKSQWRNYVTVTNQRWSHNRFVLIGDALRTAHFSIGSGTRLAIDDATALASAIAATSGVPEALARYEATRRPTVDRFIEAARASYLWYEALRDKMELEPMDLAYDYMMRTGRIDHARLRRETPKFTRRYEAHAIR